MSFAMAIVIVYALEQRVIIMYITSRVIFNVGEGG